MVPLQMHLQGVLSEFCRHSVSHIARRISQVHCGKVSLQTLRKSGLSVNRLGNIMLHACLSLATSPSLIVADRHSSYPVTTPLRLRQHLDLYTVLILLIRTATARCCLVTVTAVLPSDHFRLLGKTFITRRKPRIT